MTVLMVMNRRKLIAFEETSLNATSRLSLLRANQLRRSILGWSDKLSKFRIFTDALLARRMIMEMAWEINTKRALDVGVIDSGTAKFLSVIVT